MISLAIADFTQAEFLGKRDVQVHKAKNISFFFQTYFKSILLFLKGRLIPTEQHITYESWQSRNTLAFGNLMANGCKSAVLLADMDDKVCPGTTQLFKLFEKRLLTL